MRPGNVHFVDEAALRRDVLSTQFCISRKGDGWITVAENLGERVDVALRHCPVTRHRVAEIVKAKPGDFRASQRPHPARFDVLGGRDRPSLCLPRLP